VYCMKQTEPIGPVAIVKLVVDSVVELLASGVELLQDLLSFHCVTPSVLYVSLKSAAFVCTQHSLNTV
jgi:hypothetical protein